MRAGTCCEVVRFTPRQGAEARLLEIRPEMLEQLKRNFSGFVDTRLQRAEDGSWIDIWWWETRDQAQATIDEKERVPLFLEWERLVDVVSFDWTEVIA